MNAKWKLRRLRLEPLWLATYTNLEDVAEELCKADFREFVLYYLKRKGAAFPAIIDSGLYLVRHVAYLSQSHCLVDRLLEGLAVVSPDHMQTSKTVFADMCLSEQSMLEWALPSQQALLRNSIVEILRIIGVDADPRLGEMIDPRILDLVR